MFGALTRSRAHLAASEPENEELKPQLSPLIRQRRPTIDRMFAIASLPPAWEAYVVTFG
jgi:hypothetical protein